MELFGLFFPVASSLWTLFIGFILGCACAWPRGIKEGLARSERKRQQQGATQNYIIALQEMMRRFK